jgi:hypothetical protein
MSPGFVVADITALKALPAANRRPDLPICVGSEDAWYIFKDGSAVAESLPSIVEPTEPGGRWIRMQATDASPGGGAGGGAATIAVITAPPSGAPSGAGDSRAQDTIVTGSVSVLSYSTNALTTINYKIQRRAIWVAGGSTIGSWARFGDVATTLEYLNIVGFSNDPNNLEWSDLVAERYFRFDLDLHPQYAGERLIESWVTPDGSSRSTPYTAVPVGSRYWAYSSLGAPPTVSPGLQWTQSGETLQVEDLDFYNN